MAFANNTMNTQAKNYANDAEPVNWTSLIYSIRAGDPSGMENLYLLFERGVRLSIARRLGSQDVEDKVHDVFLIVIQAIRRGELREPERLMGFVKTIAERQIAGHVGQMIRNRGDQSLSEGSIADNPAASSPEVKATAAERLKLMRQTLKCLPAKQREILCRFYLREESAEKICTEMRLTDTQFRLLKSRAKARFGQIGRRKLSPPTQKTASYRLHTVDAPNDRIATTLSTCEYC